LLTNYTAADTKLRLYGQLDIDHTRSTRSGASKPSGIKMKFVVIDV